MAGEAEVRLLRIAARQRSVVTLAQALASGVAKSTIARYVSVGRWVRLYRGVFVVGGVEIGWQQRVMAAWLACGARSVLSFSSASAVWTFSDDVDVPGITTSLTERRRHPGIEIHRTGRLEAATYQGFRETPPMRTLLDLAAVEREDRLAQYVDLAHRKRWIDLERFGAYLAEPFAIARPGSRALRAIVAARDPSSRIDSSAETLLFEALRRSRVPLPQTQFWVTTRRRRCRIDFAYADLRVAIEVDSWEDHGTRSAFESDRARQNELVELGWRVVRFTWLQLTTEPVDVAITVARTIGLEPSRWRTGA